MLSNNILFNNFSFKSKKFSQNLNKTQRVFKLLKLSKHFPIYSIPLSDILL